MNGDAMAGAVLLYPLTYAALARGLRWRNRRLSTAVFGGMVVGALGPVVLGLIIGGVGYFATERGFRHVAEPLAVGGVALFASGALVCVPAFGWWVMPLRPEGRSPDEQVPD